MGLLDYRIDAARGLVTLTFAGRVGEDEVTAARDQVTADPAFRADYAWLVDAAAADVGPLSAPRMRERAHRPPTRAPIAIVVASEVGYGLGRMYGAVTTGRAAVFRDRDAALDWLAAVHPHHGASP